MNQDQLLRKFSIPKLKKKFQANKLNQAINLICYGQYVNKYNKNGKKIQRIYYIFEDDNEYLQYIHNKKNYAQSRISLTEITEIREQPTNEQFQKIQSDRLLEIKFQNREHVLEFRNQEERDLWHQGLTYFINEAIQSQRQDLAKQLGKKMFFQADQDGSKSLTFNEVKRLILSMHLQIADQQLKNLFNQYDQDNNGNIDYEEFQQMVKQLVTYDDIKDIYKLYANAEKDFEDHEGIMTKEDFHKFLTQKQQLLDFQAKIIMKQYMRESQSISFQTFVGYFLGNSNSAFEIFKQSIYQDMTQPLQHYYINSSHNTYLMSNQLTGQSSIQGYINAIQKGCRCVELDCWDGPNNNPIIYHGYTMTSKITFESVIQAIKEYAFRYSEYPLILSLEVHCNSEQQDVMADLMNKYFGNKIYLLPENYETIVDFPSPSDLKKKNILKIIIKNKGNLQSLGNFYSKNSQDNQQKSVNQIDQLGLKKIVISSSDKEEYRAKLRQEMEIINLRLKEQFHYRNPHLSQYNSNLDESFEDQRTDAQKFIHSTTTIVATKNTKIRKSSFIIQKSESENKEIKKPLKESLKLQSLVTMFGIQMSFSKKRSIWEISSLDENRVLQYIKSNEKEIIQFHSKAFTRIYPAGSRVDSSNYDPIPAFNVGSQIVALNFQTNDFPMLLNQAKFTENGGIESGYVLKPEWMKLGNKLLSSFTSVQLVLDLHIICGYNLRPEVEDFSDIIDPFLKVSIKGIQLDEQNNNIGKSQVVYNNGLNPKFDFKWSASIRCIDLAFIMIEIYDEDVVKNDFVGWASIPVKCLAEGYRNIQLLNTQLKPIQNSLLIAHIQQSRR